jgi:hypothetical protein
MELFPYDNKWQSGLFGSGWRRATPESLNPSRTMLKLCLRFGFISLDAVCKV